MLGQRGQVGGVVIHVVAAADLGRAAVAAPVMRDDAIAASEEEQHLRVPIVRGERPPMAENDRLPAAPVLVENLDAVAGRDRGHFSDPSPEREADASGPEQLPETAAAGD